MKKHLKYDLFLSHAVEDKSRIADELNRKLREAGFVVWYSGSDLKAGDTMEDAILMQAIPQSRLFIALISTDYLKSGWTRKEFNAAASLETTQKKILVPILFNVTFEEVSEVFPLQENRFAIKTSDADSILRQLFKVCKNLLPLSSRQLPESHRRKGTVPSQVKIKDVGAVSLGGNIQITGNTIAGRDLHLNTKINKSQNGGRKRSSRS